MQLLLPRTTCNTNLLLLTGRPLHLVTASEPSLQCLNLQVGTAKVTSSIYKGHICNNIIGMAEYREQPGCEAHPQNFRFCWHTCSSSPTVSDIL